MIHCLRPSRISFLILFVTRLSLLSLICFPVVPAQYHFESWTTDNGLPQNSIRSIVQTRDGYLWMATFDGLVRFNGVQFKVFDKSNTRGLSTNRFTVLYEDKDGTLLIGTGDGGLTSYRNGVFTSYTATDGVPAGQIISFTHDLNGELLLGIGSGKFYKRNGKFIPAPPEYSDQNTRHYLAPSGGQWTIRPGEAREIKAGRITRYPMTLNLPSGSWPFEDSKGNLWLSEPGNLYRLRDGRVTRYSQKDGLSPRTVLHPYCEDNEGGIWFAGEPLVRFKDGRFTAYGNEILAGLSVNTILKDHEGTIWIGTSRGLYRLTKQFITGYSTASGLLHREVYPILQSRNGDIWVGSIRGLSRFSDGDFHNTLLPAPNNIVQALGEDAQGRLWIGLVGGLLRYEDGKLKDLSSLIKATVSTILTDRAGNVWVGSERGLFKFQNDQVAAHYTTKEGLPADDVTVIYEDRHGSLWIATPGNLSRFEQGKFISHAMPGRQAANHIRCLYEDADGTFWLGTYDDGLLRFRDGRFFKYTVDQGLFNNGVCQILEDRRGYLAIDLADGNADCDNNVWKGNSFTSANQPCIQ